MRSAFVVFDEMTPLDFVGCYDPLTRLKSMGFQPDFSWQICACRNPEVDSEALRVIPDSVGSSLADFDLIVVPGGYGTRDLQYDEEFISWLRTAKEVPLKASVCTGSLLLGAAGYLHGKKATTHPKALAELAPYCHEVVDQRLVDQGDVITARGVTSAIDLGLYLVERLAGESVREQVALQMDYPFFSIDR